MKSIPIADFAPPYAADSYTKEDAYLVSPFFTNLDHPVYASLISSPEVIGALCSRASRAAGDLRPIFLNEYIKPFLESHNTEHKAYGDELREFITFLHQHPIETIFSNPRARSFYTKWLAQYGDDSIAQMAGMHIVFSSLSMLAIKHFEDQRIGLAPIEKSTRYVNYGDKVNGQYQYYTDPTLARVGLETEYRAAMDALFDTYGSLLPRLQAWLEKRFPDEKAAVVEKKAFDTLRGLLPVSTLSQVAFFGNGQAFEYLFSRSNKHPLGEIRWAAEQTYQELYKIAPSFLRRVKDENNQNAISKYQEYLSGKTERMTSPAERHIPQQQRRGGNTGQADVNLVEYDPDGENKVIAGMLYAAANNHASWNETLQAVQALDTPAKKEIIASYLAGRDQRWQKVGRAFENASMRFEITMNIGSWTDLQRHRMLTQQRQLFSCVHGYDIPVEVADAGLEGEYKTAVERIEAVHEKIASHSVYTAQYAVTRAHRVRFTQVKNMRAAFWEMELRTIPEGHPDYRRVEQEKFRLLKKAYPLLTEHMRVNMGEYDFARRGQEEKIQTKMKELEKLSA